MDVSFLRSKDAALTCDFCSYPRRGLPDGALCPECGNPPPPIDESEQIKSGFTRKQQIQFRLASIGLMILMIASFYALRVCIIMDGEALAAINVPSPKVSGVILVQREVGGRPGEWGVLGWMSCLWTMIGVWLITARRAINREGNLWASSRQIARWSTIILTGGLMGYLLSDLNEYIPLNGRYTDGLLLVALLSVEIPVNFFLYRYFHHLSIQIRQPRLATWFGTLAWIGAMARFIQLLTLLPGDQIWSHIPHWRMISGVVESMIAIPIGVVSWGAVMLLTGAMIKSGYGSVTQRSILLLRDRPGVVRQLCAIGQKHFHRIAIVCGLIIWMGMAINRQSENLLSRYYLHESSANAPAIHFAGPQISAMVYWNTWYNGVGPAISDSLITEMLVIMLLTTALPGQSGGEARLRFTLRWVGVIVICMTTHVIYQLHFAKAHPGITNTLKTIFIDAFATGAIYYYLSLVARRIGATEISHWLRRLAMYLPLLMIMPKALYLTGTTRGNVGVTESLFTATVCTANLLALLICLQILSRFILAILRPMLQPGSNSSTESVAQSIR